MCSSVCSEQLCVFSAVFMLSVVLQVKCICVLSVVLSLVAARTR